MITKKQKDKQKNYVGSSQAAAIMGCAPQKKDGTPMETAMDIWLEKKGRLEAKQETEDMKLGHQFESVALRLAVPFFGSISAGGEFILESEHLISHPDGIILPEAEPVEAKESGIRNPYWAKEHWGEENTDQVPDWVIIQCQVHIMATKKTVCHIPTILGGRGFVMFFVPEDKALQQMILDAVGHFWNEHVVKDIPPENVLPSLQSIKRILRKPESVIEIARELVDEREMKNVLLKKAEKDFEIADMALKTALGTAEIGYFEGGEITYFQYHKKAETKLREAYDFRRLKIKKYKDVIVYKEN